MTDTSKQDEVAIASSSASAAAAASPSTLTLCWCWNLHSVPPSTSDSFISLLNLLPTSDRTAVMRFHFDADRKRALISRISSRLLCAAITREPATDIIFQRSMYGKPSLPPSHAWKSRLAFNASHHGDLILLCAEALLAREASSPSSVPLLGCDVTTCALPAGLSSVEEYFTCMESCFTPHEWKIIRQPDAHDVDSPLHQFEPMSSSSGSSSCAKCAMIRFAWMWSLKESLVKAIGMGLSFELQHIQFRFPADNEQRAVCSPIMVEFLGAPTFAKNVTSKAGSGPTTTPAASSSSQPVLEIPIELADVKDLRVDIEWKFDSALVYQGTHIISRCTGVRKHDQTSLSSNSISSSQPSSSVEDTTSTLPLPLVQNPLQLLHLGTLVPSHTSAASHVSSDSGSHLQLRELKFEQLLAIPNPAPNSS